MSSKATIRMKEKKQRMLDAANAGVGVVKEVEEIKVELVDDDNIISIDSGTVTSVDVIAAGPDPGCVVDDEPPNEGYTEEELRGMLVGELVEYAERIGVNSNGSKAVLIRRLLNA